MPESRSRKQEEYTPPPQKKATKPPRLQPWVGPAMVTLLVIGLIWIVVYYVTQADFPVEALGNWNLVVGLAFILGGCVLSTKWR